MRHLNYFKEHIDVDQYQHGSCEVFALAMHMELGYDMYFLLDEQAFFEDDGDGFYGEALVHAYCGNKSGRMFDVTGEIDEDYLFKEFEVNEPKIIQVSDIDFQNMVNDKFIAKTDEKELQDCIS